MKPTQQELLALFSYDPTTGLLIRRNGKRKNPIAGHLKKDDGYLQVQGIGVSYRTIYVGTFKTIEAAKAARIAAEVAHFGEFARP